VLGGFYFFYNGSVGYKGRTRSQGFVLKKKNAIFIFSAMLAKYTLRWKFYRTVAIFYNAPYYDLVLKYGLFIL